MKYSHVGTSCFSRTVNTTFVDWTNLLNARQMKVYYISDFIHGSIIIIPFGFYHICKNVVIPRVTSYKQALGEDCTTVITTTVHIPGHLLQRCSEQLIRSCVFWEANVWSSSRTNKRTRIKNTLLEVCLVRIKAQVLRTPCLNLNLNLNVWCLTPLSAIFQLYHGDQFQRWKPEYPERTTYPGQATGKRYHLQLRVEWILFVI